MLRVDVVRRSGHRVESMERFAGALLAAGGHQPLTGGDVLTLRAVEVPAARPNAGRPERLANRWVRLPLGLRSSDASAFHVIDHSDAHLLRVLPVDRTVVSCHDLLLLRAAAGELPYTGRRWWVRRFEWTVSHLRTAAAVACATESTRTDLIRFVGVEPGRIHKIGYGVDPAFKPPTAEHRKEVRDRLGFAGRRVILHVGSGGFYKNSAVTLPVLKAVRDGGVDAQLIRVGTPMTDQERTVAERQCVSEHIRDLGRVPEEDLIDLYGSADVLLFPSRAEGFGLPVLEAMASGTPVVTSDAAALVEVTGGAGLQAAADDVRGLAGRVAEVLTDDGLAAALSRRGVERATAFTWEGVRNQYAAIYRRLAGA